MVTTEDGVCGSPVSEKNSTRKLADQARLRTPLPRYGRQKRRAALKFQL